MEIMIDFTKHYRNLDECDKYRVFRSRKAAKEWIMEGLVGCEGAEREHYVNMLVELESGKNTLTY